MVAVDEFDVVNPLAATTFSNIKNNCASVLNVSITSSDTTVQLVAGSGSTFPATPFYCSCEYEVMLCTGKSTDTLTVTRGQDGTTAAAHSAGTIIEQRNNAALWNDIALAVNKIENGTTPVPINAPNSSITNTMLASDVPRPNLIQNGSFENWHRGNGPFAAGASISADNWVLLLSGADTLSVVRDSANADGVVGYCAAITCVVSGGAGLTSLFSTTQAAYDPGITLTDVLGKQLTATVRIKCSVANSVRIGINNYIAANNTTYSSFHTGNGTYQTLTVTANISPTATVCQLLISFSVSSTAYVDNATLVYGAVPVLYTPAQIPDSIPNQRLASDVARSNLLVNGGFETWQRGNGPFTIHGAYAADRWSLSATVGSLSVSRDSANVPLGSGSQYCLVVTAVISGGTQIQIVQSLENRPSLYGLTLTFSAMVKCATTNAIRLRVYDNGVAVTSSPHSGSGQWERLSITFTPAASGSLNWTQFAFDANCTAYIDNAMLVVGSVPADYAPLHPADDLARCQRYFFKIATGSSNAILLAQCGGPTNFYGTWQLPVRSGGVPTVTASAASSFAVWNSGTVPQTVTGAPNLFTTNDPQPTILGLQGTAAGLVAGNAALLVGNVGGSTLQSEWNP